MQKLMNKLLMMLTIFITQQGVKKNDSLYNQIKELGIDISKVGDGLNPQTVMKAVAKGYKLANNA